MKAIGICIALYGFLLTVTGHHWEYFAYMTLGAALYAGGLYIEKR